jgi:hypothetical protein
MEKMSRVWRKPTALSVLLAVLIIGCSDQSKEQAEGAGRQEEKSADVSAEQSPEETVYVAANYCPLTAGSEWNYQLKIPADTEVPVAPYFIEPDYIVGSNITNGMVWRNSGTWQVSLKAVDNPEPSTARIEVTGEILPLWFRLRTSEMRMVLKPWKEDILLLELQGFIDVPSDNSKQWILGHRLALLPESEAKEVKQEYMATEISVVPVKVGAGDFNKSIHSRSSRGDGQYSPFHVVESWLVEGVGLVKMVVSETTGKEIYSLELTDYKIAK